MCRESVKNLRANKCDSVTTQSGYYLWWFNKIAAIKLLGPLDVVDAEINKIPCTKIEENEYWCLYFGISKNLSMRAKWHIMQKHRESTVKHGALSTLRQSLSALLKKEMSQSENCINKFMDENCYWEWHQASNPEEKEKQELSSKKKSYPLNIKGNKTVCKETRNKLRRCRKEYKK